MTDSVDKNFPALFLDAADLPAGMIVYQRRDGAGDPDDAAFALHGGRNIGIAKWQGADNSLLQLFIDIRWLFPDPRSATAYHLATLTAKSEGKAEVSAREKVGRDCHVYSFPSGQALGAAQDIYRRTLGEQHHFTRGIAHAVANFPNNAFIFLFTSGPVAVKFLAVLNSPPESRDTAPDAVYDLATRIVERIDGAIPAGEPTVKPWWTRFLRF